MRKTEKTQEIYEFDFFAISVNMKNKRLIKPLLVVSVGQIPNMAVTGPNR